MATKAQLEAHIAALQAEIAAAHTDSVYGDSAFKTEEDAAAFSQFIASMMPNASDMIRFVASMTITAVYSGLISIVVSPYISMLMMLTSSVMLQSLIYLACITAVLMFAWYTSNYVVTAVLSAPAHAATAFNATKRVASRTLDTTVEYTSTAYTGIRSWVARKLNHVVAA